METNELIDRLGEKRFDDLDQIWRVIYLGLLGIECDTPEIIKGVLVDYQNEDLSSKEVREEIADEILGEIT